LAFKEGENTLLQQHEYEGGLSKRLKKQKGRTLASGRGGAGAPERGRGQGVLSLG